MLLLNLAEVARGPVRLRGEVASDAALWENTGIPLSGPLRFDLDARSVGEAVLVRGEVDGPIESSCRRCLAPVMVRLHDTVDMLFDRLTPEERNELEGEVLSLPERGDVLDLGPAIREQVLLRVPDYVLCDESCRGICPRCGADLNRQECGCTAPSDDEGPWSALKKLRFE
ncbi:MAG: DUF177 domain-containing protein [Gemmatimonadota bacterium]|jgi:uncharacterized protein|nr:DUF177 domain-containing protein [Gemmatimonadota bacterium]